MKTIFVKQLEEGKELFDQPFLMIDATPRKTRDGRPYLLFNLVDRTGRVGGVYWNVPDEVVQSCSPGTVVLVTGNVHLYNQRLQVVALDLQPYEPDSMADFTVASRRNRDEMVDELTKVIGELREPLRQLLTEILLEPQFLRRFAEAPAAKIMHHAYVSGLLEHSLALVPFCRLAASQYPGVDEDLLVTGALLHDVGKTASYELNSTFAITDEEKLVGHIALGMNILEKATGKIPDFPSHLRQHLLHLLVSHHGTAEWGSPVTPRTLEAVLLHQIDLLDSRVQGFIDYTGSEAGDSRWTSPSPMFGYELMRK